jgi:energy-coupling factor transport system ATP-binding protein
MTSDARPRPAPDGPQLDPAAIAVRAERFGFTYAGREAATLTEITFALPAGSWTLVVGPTGSGKSTLLRAIAGLVPRHSAGVGTGDLTLFGHDPAALAPGQRALLAGLVLQSPDEQLIASTVEAEIAFGLENLALDPRQIDRRIDAALDRAGLGGLRQSRADALSGGQKQRLAIAAVLAMGPRLLVLDEPLSQLDAAAAHELLELLERLRSEGLTLVVAEHRLDETLPRADRLLVLRDGRIAAEVQPIAPAAAAAALESAGLPPPDLVALARRLDCTPTWDSDALADALCDEQKVAGARAGLASGLESRENQGASRPMILRVESLSAAYPGAPRRALEGISFTVARGERVALVGANGSGKSTLLAALAGLLPAATGTIALQEQDEARHVGLVLQNPDLMLTCATVGSELLLGQGEEGRRRLRASAASAPTDSCDPQLPARQVASELDVVQFWDEPPLALSQGQRLRVAVAAALADGPGVLALDEPTTGQDAAPLAAVFESLAARLRDGRLEAVLFSTHDLRAAARWADRVLVLAGGRLLADCSMDTFLADESLLSAAAMRRTPLLRLRARLELASRDVETLAAELAS